MRWFWGIFGERTIGQAVSAAKGESAAEQAEETQAKEPAAK